MAEGSHTKWADWVTQPVVCAECERRVTLQQAHRQRWDERTRSGSVVHAVCDPVTVKVIVEAAPVGSQCEGP